MLRDLRAADTPRLLELLQNEFPEEEALLGTRPEGFAKVARRIFRWDARLLLGLSRLAGRPLFRFFVLEADGRVIATTLLTFLGPTGYVSTVVVDPAYRRRGFARTLLERARAATERTGRKYIALDVLEANRPARALYEAIGYRPLRATSYLAHDDPTAFLPEPPPERRIRRFRHGDAGPLVEAVRRASPAEVERVLPVRSRDFLGSGFVSRAFTAETASWVVDGGHGPEGYVAASVSPVTTAAHLSNPIVAETLDPHVAVALVRQAGSWCAARKASRLLATVPVENRSGRTALEGVGFRHALSVWTLYRPVA